jgi:hypothetical protein
MTRYFFVVTASDGDIFDDEDGVECSSSAAALKVAHDIARQLAADNETFIGGSIEVYDDDRKEIGRLTIRLDEKTPQKGAG